MDYQFPRQLFPTFFLNGPPTAVLQQCCGKWGSYDRVLPQGGPGPLSSWTFTSRHRVRGETWRPTEPVVLPLLSPKYNVEWSSQTQEPMQFTKHMENFFQDHCHDAFGCMVEAMGEDFDVRATPISTVEKPKRNKKTRSKKEPPRPVTYLQRAYGSFLSDVMHSIPPHLLASLLHEELQEQRDRRLFFEGATGGALAFVPFGRSGSQSGCLLYPGNRGQDRLNFHRVELRHGKDLSSHVDASSCEVFSVQLRAPVRQISAASHFNECCVAVRSDYQCGVWRFGEEVEPRLLQVVDAGEQFTCVSSSPHVLGEVLVVSESGAAKLWDVGKGMQTVREEGHNLYFNARSRWRWCHFSAHPRVMVYADRTGVDLTDIRVKPAASNTLFHVGQTSECYRGERVIMSQYLEDVHSFHHLVTTQFSAYIMDERFPSLPMLKWEHLMLSPPMFCHAIPASAGGSAKLVLGSHNSQEITMLQYSGGREEACHSLGPPLALHRPQNSLERLPVQIPHRFHLAKDRLSSAATGLTCIQQDGEGGQKCVCVLQLTEVGDIFYQVLELQPPDDPVLPAQNMRSWAGRADLLVTDSSSDEDIVGPTQDPNTCRLVPETPEKEPRAQSDPESNPETDPESGSKSEPGPPKRGSPERKGEGDIGSDALTRWRHWLLKLYRKSRRGATAKAPPLTFVYMGDRTTPSHRVDEDLLVGFGEELSTIMTRRSHLAAAEQDPDLEQDQNQPLLDALDADAWSDKLSRRLTATWQGDNKEAWEAWWRLELGLDRQEKAAALLRRRRRDKAARRASGRHRQLSSSFASSATDLSDWSSHGPWSEGEGAATASSLQGPRDPASSLPPTPTSKRAANRKVIDYLNSLNAQQDDASQPDAGSNFLYQDDAAGTQLSQDTFNFLSVSQTGPRVDLSQPSQGFSPTKSQSQTQNSQPRLRPSQASQPTKKKSRMGF